MAKSLLYKLFRLGRIPPSERLYLEGEGLVLADEGVRGSITFKNFKAPWKRYSWRRNGFAGSIVLTEQRLVGYAFSKHVINVPVDDPHLKKLQITAEKEDCLCFSFEASDFHDDRSGSIEVRYRTERAWLFVRKLDKYTA
jgi:hypothetical protein